MITHPRRHPWPAYVRHLCGWHLPARVEGVAYLANTKFYRTDDGDLLLAADCTEIPFDGSPVLDDTEFQWQGQEDRDSAT
jgi:hypothetical protein